MDERLEKALAFSNYRITIENKRIALKRRFATMLVVHNNNGMFLADAATISFVATLIEAGATDSVLIDQKNAPIEVADLDTFKTELIDTYYKATNEYASEMKKLSTARNVKKAMDW
jgi:hypothetical protein